MSQDPSSLSLSNASLFPPIRSTAIRAVSSGFNTPMPGIFNCTSSPFTSTWGARPGEKIKSLIFGAARNIVAMMTGVDTGATDAAAGIVGTGTGISMAPPSSRPRSKRTPAGNLQYDRTLQRPYQPPRQSVLKALVVLKVTRSCCSPHRRLNRHGSSPSPVWAQHAVPAGASAFSIRRVEGDSLTSSIRLRCKCLGRFNPIDFFHLGGELDYESCAAFRAIETFDLAAMFLKDPVANAQAQPGAFAYRLGGKKRIENLLRIFYPRARV